MAHWTGDVMLRQLFTLFLVGVSLLAQQPTEPKKASALDKAAMEAYIRHLFVWPPPIQVQIDDPKAGPMAGFYAVKMRGVNGNQQQEETFFVSTDGAKMVRGQVLDIAQNPFRRELDLIKTDTQPAFGTAGAPVVIAEFSDYECPYCREEAKTLRDNILKTYPKEVRVYYFDFPLEQIHPWARAGAIAGRCVFQQSVSTYWQFHDWIFENQKDITPENLKTKVMDFAKGKEVDSALLNTCIDTKATSADVDRTLAMGAALSINQTPTMFINGRRLSGTVPWNDLKFIIDYEIGYQKTAKNAGDDCGCNLTLPTPGVSPVGTGPSLK